MAAPKKIAELVKLFIRNRDAYLSGEYNEAQVRQEFIQRQIDKLVYKLYHLIEEEIKIVKEGT